MAIVILVDSSASISKKISNSSFNRANLFTFGILEFLKKLQESERGPVIILEISSTTKIISPLGFDWKMHQEKIINIKPQDKLDLHYCLNFLENLILTSLQNFSKIETVWFLDNPSISSCTISTPFFIFTLIIEIFFLLMKAFSKGMKKIKEKIFVSKNIEAFQNQNLINLYLKNSLLFHFIILTENSSNQEFYKKKLKNVHLIRFDKINNDSTLFSKQSGIEREMSKTIDQLFLHSFSNNKHSLFIGHLHFSFQLYPPSNQILPSSLSVMGFLPCQQYLSLQSSSQHIVLPHLPSPSKCDAPSIKVEENQTGGEYEEELKMTRQFNQQYQNERNKSFAFLLHQSLKKNQLISLIRIDQNQFAFLQSVKSNLQHPTKSNNFYLSLTIFPSNPSSSFLLQPTPNFNLFRVSSSHPNSNNAMLPHNIQLPENPNQEKQTKLANSRKTNDSLLFACSFSQVDLTISFLLQLVPKLPASKPILIQKADKLRRISLVFNIPNLLPSLANKIEQRFKNYQPIQGLVALFRENDLTLPIENF